MSHHHPVRLLGLSGSLRASSSNTALVDAAGLLAQAPLSLTRFDGIRALPHFDPDLEAAAVLPAPVRVLRDAVAQADGLILSCPEYARGVPGAFKNALDWLVGSERVAGKPVALWNASPRSHHAQDALRLILSTMAARLVDAACIEVPLLGRRLDAAGITDDDDLRARIRTGLASFAAATD